MIINKYILKKIEGVFSSFVFNHGRMLLCHKTRFWIAPGKSRFINVFLLPHFLFRMMVMVNPRRTFSFNFQSILDSSVDYVFAAPCCFVAKFLWKSPRVVLVLFVSGYCPIAIVVPRSPRQRAASIAIQENYLRCIYHSSLNTVLKKRRFSQYNEASEISYERAG